MMKELKEKLNLYSSRFKIADNTDLTKLKSALAFGYKNGNHVPKEEFKNELQLIELSGFYECTNHRFHFTFVTMPEQYVDRVACFINHKHALLLLDTFEIYKTSLNKKISDIEEAIRDYEEAIKDLKIHLINE